MMKYRIIALLLAALIALAGCAGPSAPQTAAATQSSAASAVAQNEANDWDASKAVEVTLENGTFQTTGAGLSVKDNVLTIAKSGAYVLSGTLENGQVVVDAEDLDVQLILNGVHLTCPTSAPIYGKAGKLTVTLAEGTENSLTDGAEYAFADGDDEPNAALFSKDDLIIGGTGKLTVNGQYRDGIAGKDDLTIVGGVLDVTAKEDAIRGKDTLTVNGGDITVQAGLDGLKSNNSTDVNKGIVTLNGGTLNIVAGNDGVQAETLLRITGGDYNVTTGGGSGDGHYQGETSCKGLKAGTDVTITGGVFTLDTLDDAVHSDGTVDISGGEFAIATGDDAIHGEAEVTVSGGDIRVDKCYEGLEGLNVTVSDGTVHITASDDGINAADPTVQEGPGAMGGGMGRRGQGGATQAQTDPASPSNQSVSTSRPEPAREAPPQDLAGNPPQMPVDMAGGGGPGGRTANENVFIRITGGAVVVDAAGDALDSNGALYLEGGTVLLNGPTSNGDGALDYDGECAVTGGTFVAAGSAGMAQAPGDTSTQPSVMVYFTEEQAGGTVVNLSKQDGTSIVTFVPAKKFQTILISSPDLQEGDTVVLSTGGDDQVDNDGFAAGGNWSGGTKRTEVVLSGMVTKVSEDGSAVTGRGGMGGGGRGRGGFPGGTEMPAAPAQT